MRQFAFLSLLLLLFAINADAQRKVKEKDVIGQWEMIIPELEKTKDGYKHDEDRDAEGDSASSRFERAIESAVGSFVGELLGDMRFVFSFEKDHSAKLRIEVMGEVEIESLRWSINNDGALVIQDGEDNDGDHISVDDVWMMQNRRLVQVDSDGRVDEDVYMERVGK